MSSAVLDAPAHHDRRQGHPLPAEPLVLRRAEDHRCAVAPLSRGEVIRRVAIAACLVAALLVSVIGGRMPWHDVLTSLPVR